MPVAFLFCIWINILEVDSFIDIYYRDKFTVEDKLQSIESLKLFTGRFQYTFVPKINDPSGF